MLGIRFECAGYVSTDPVVVTLMNLCRGYPGNDEPDFDTHFNNEMNDLSTQIRMIVKSESGAAVELLFNKDCFKKLRAFKRSDCDRFVNVRDIGYTPEGHVSVIFKQRNEGGSFTHSLQWLKVVDGHAMVTAIHSDPNDPSIGWIPLNTDKYIYFAKAVSL